MYVCVYVCVCVVCVRAGICLPGSFNQGRTSRHLKPAGVRGTRLLQQWLSIPHCLPAHQQLLSLPRSVAPPPPLPQQRALTGHMRTSSSTVLRKSGLSSSASSAFS